MKTPKFFYFDLGNVLLHFDHSLSARQVAELAGCPYQVAWDVVFGQHDLEGQYESGQLTGESFHRRFCELTGTTPPLKEFLHAASAIFWPVAGNIPLVAQLHNAGYRLGILSNTCDGHWDYCRRHYPFLTWYFPVVCLSYEACVMKPDAAIYRHACDKVGLKPQDVFFVDDRDDNVAGAKAVGMDAVRFTTTPQLARDLYDRGVRMNF